MVDALLFGASGVRSIAESASVSSKLRSGQKRKRVINGRCSFTVANGELGDLA